MSNEQGGLAKSSPTRSNVSSFWTLSDEKKRLKIFKNFYAKFACFVASCLVYLSVWGWPLYKTMCFPLSPWGPSGLLNVSWVSSSCSEKILSNPYKSCFFFSFHDEVSSFSSQRRMSIPWSRTTRIQLNFIFLCISPETLTLVWLVHNLSD